MILPKPYYDDSAVTIYHGDCMDILPLLEPVDLVLTDPPYGTESLGGGYGRRQNHSPNGRMGRTIEGDKDLETMKSAFSLMPLSQNANICTFVAPQRMLEAAAICVGFGWKYAGECIWEKVTPEKAALSVIRKSVDHINTQARHPHEKPVIFWTNLLPLCDGMVLDPFMGSGTTLRAAKDLGRKAIGIELEEKYCEIAAQRMCQEVLL